MHEVKRTMRSVQNIHLARKLRSNQTDAERLLWQYLRNNSLNIKFRRLVAMGSYVADFVAYSKKLIIEVDGGQHNEEGIKFNDEERTKFFEKQGYKVIRFWNNEVLKNLDSVIIVIQEHLC